MHVNPTLRQAIVALNQEPLNRAAAMLLPSDWLNPATLHILSLALWGAENGIGVELPGARVTDDDVRAALLGLFRADPVRVLELFEGSADGADVMLIPEDLKETDRGQGAFRILEAIRDRLIAS